MGIPPNNDFYGNRNDMPWKAGLSYIFDKPTVNHVLCFMKSYLLGIWVLGQVKRVDRTAALVGMWGRSQLYSRKVRCKVEYLYLHDWVISGVTVSKHTRHGAFGYDSTITEYMVFVGPRPAFLFTPNLAWQSPRLSYLHIWVCLNIGYSQIWWSIVVYPCLSTVFWPWNSWKCTKLGVHISFWPAQGDFQGQKTFLGRKNWRRSQRGNERYFRWFDYSDVWNKSMGVPQNGWLILEKPLEMDNLGVLF